MHTPGLLGRIYNIYPVCVEHIVEYRIIEKNKS